MAATAIAVYRERHHLIAHLAAAHPSVMVLGADPDEPDWPVIYIQLPTGQVSWHIAPADMDLFRHVPTGTAEWDGHDTAAKYERLDAHTRALAEVGQSSPQLTTPPPPPPSHANPALIGHIEKSPGRTDTSRIPILSERQLDRYFRR